MSGKAYTMKEMKDIVDYLTEHKAYSDIKGRKMWMDMASSDVTSRTWQSLKETFLKRILPDIHNPYYKLSVHQLASFKQGCDIEAKLNNKLEIRSSDAVSTNTEDDNNKIIDQEEKGIENNEDVPSGENLQQLESNTRDSTDTLVLENCYQAAEDIKRDLPSANEDDDKEEDAQPKSLRDLITYSEPLSVLQHTIDDFATDEEASNGEPQMQIVESEEIAKKDSNNGNNCVIEIPDSDSGEKEKTNQSPAKQDKAILLQPNNEKSAETITDIVEVESEKNNESAALFPENHVGNKTNEAETISKIDNKTDSQRKSSEITQNTNTITDSLPNNQEAFQNKTKQSSKKDQISVTNEDKKISRKRAISQEPSQPKDLKKRSLSLKKQSISDSDTIALNTDKKKRNSKIVEKKLNKIDEANKPGSNEKLTNIDKNTEAATVNTSDLVHQDVDMTTSDVENPCLKSVSLYEEELSYNKKLESQKEKNETPSEKPIDINKNAGNEIVVLKSHSDSITDSSKVLTPPKKGKKEATKQRRDRAMADVFGFSRAGVNKKRKRTVSYKHSTSHQVHHISSGSSEWTSDSDSEFISPPRGRRNRQTRKYLKPRHARILSLEDEGGLFVMYGKKIYPIVKDGKIIKNYVTYTPEEEVEHEESFWKLKYVEEKKKTDELTKLLNRAQEKDDGSQGSALALTEKEISNFKQKEVIKAKQDVPDNNSMEVPIKTDSEDKTIKFKFTKNNEELQLEGHWSHVNPVLAQVMQLLQKDEKKDDNDQTNTSSTNKSKKNTKTSNEQKNTKQNVPTVNGTKSSEQVRVSQESRQSTPVIPIDIEDEVEERVSKIESEIFKEIEENEIKESTKKKVSQPEEHITKRRGRPRKSSVISSSASTSASPSKKIKLDAEPNKDEDISEKNNKKSPKKSLNESPNKTRTRELLSRKSKEVVTPNLNNKGKEEAPKKLPTPPQTKKSKIAKASKPKANRYLTPLDCKPHSSPESRSMCSIDSTQDLQDSNESMMRMSLRKRKGTSIAYKRKSVHRYRTNSHPFLTDDITSESSNSYQSSPVKSMTFQNSTIGSDNYSSESYRLLMNRNLTQKNKMFQNLEKIVESPNLNELKSISEQIYEDIMANDVEMQTDRKIKDGTFKVVRTDEDSVSNVSLPTSPVLSIVQNISVSKDLLSSVDDFPIEDLHYNNQIILNNFIKSEADVSMPLMARDCGIESNGHSGEEYHYNLNVIKDTPVSETFINKVNTFNIKDPTLTDSINTKLKGLMLESTKKTIKGVCGSDENNNMEIAENIKTKSRKRSSTPLKRKSARRLTLSVNEPCIEEHTESCSYSRKSCPPVVQHSENIAINTNLEQNISKPKTRQTKNVIKVKITKPKQKSGKGKKADKTSEKAMSDIIDGSVNESESGVFLNCFNDSVDLIHNHSDTCLKAHDCMGDSVELLEDSKSVVFLDSTGNSENLLHKQHDNVNSIEYELFSNDAQDASELGKVKSTSSAVFHSLIGSLSQQNSLITEDLSDESPVKNTEDKGNKIARNTKWYLLSEDETTNTNFVNNYPNSAAGLGYGADLNQIFPITCAVPELSTITEVSNQNEENLNLTPSDCKPHSSPESRSMCSIDSTQDLQDSNESMMRMSLRKRKGTSIAYKRKSVHRYRTNSHPFLTDDITSESSNSYQSSPVKSMTFQNSTIGSDNYSSESYRLLMNRNLTQKNKMFQNLEKIVESPNLNELKSISEQIYEDIMANDVEMQTDGKIKDGTFKVVRTDEDSVSNVSLPTSPVLSIVQNISVSKDLLSSVDDFPIEDLHYNNQIILNNFIKSEADVSMPLMARDCGIESNGHSGEEYHYNLNVIKDTPVSETFINKVNTFNIKDPTLTDSINTKLKGLMLESTKKTIKGVCGSDENNNMEIAENIKTKSRKRSSTPLKRKSARRLTLSVNEPCIEEHTESCSYSRKSCPPVVQHSENIAINTNLEQNISKPKTRQTKNVIKVKITKPKQKSGKGKKADKTSEKAMSDIIDGSVNESESGVFLNCFNDSVDLIHNHSDTCLKAHDCMGDSVELLEDSKSVVFLDSTGNSENLLHKQHDNVNSIEYELFSNDAQDASELGKVKSTSSAVFHSLIGSLSQQNSLITEDLSDESPVKNTEDKGNKIARNTKWYLLSEDETTNTNFVNNYPNSAAGLGYGADLNQIFPITCAVPELSTITEVSNQNEENLK